MISDFEHKAVGLLKELAHGRRGEQYRIGGQTLRYLPGTHPIRLSLSPL